MALLDARLLSLVETLANAGLDWLAFELVDGIRLGSLQEETEATLEQARLRARDPNRYRGDLPSQDFQATSEPILSDEQLVWAVQYVNDRLDDIVGALESSFENLEAVGVQEGHIGRQLQADKDVAITLVLAEAEGDYKLRASDLNEAKQGIEILRGGLEDWLSEQIEQEISDDPPSPGSFG